MGWLISEYWLWLVFAALLGALASAAFTLRKVEVHSPPASRSAARGPVEQEPAAAAEADEPEELEEPEEYDDRSFAPPADEEPDAEDEPEPEPDTGTEPEPAEFGPGSAAPLPDGSSPGEEFTVKANVNSMQFHTQESPYYGRTRAEVWFDSEESARAAGFARWDDED